MTFVHETARKVGRMPLVRGFKHFDVVRDAAVKLAPVSGPKGAHDLDHIAQVIAKDFDADFYRSQPGVPDLSDDDLILHYLRSDVAGMLNPNSHFDSQFYLRNSKDVAETGLNPFYHYVTWGRAEGRSANEAEEGEKAVIAAIADHFDADFYAGQVGAPKGKPDALLEHFALNGHASQLSPNANFDSRFYLANNDDVRESGVNPYYHYLCWGQAEGRAASAADQLGLAPGQIEKTLKTHMNEAFYLDQADPDRTRGLNSVDHYCAYGWRQGFDPNPSFSTTDYLRLNPEVEESGLNPFFHFLSTGKFQGRPRKHSKRAVQQATTHPNSATSDLPRVGVVSMIKNEADIIRLFASHILKLFDEIVLIDHMSEDGSSDILKQLEETRENVTRYVLKEPGYIQDIVSNHVARECKALGDMDWVMFLDADEFLPFESNKELRHFLAANAEHAIISFGWKTLIPAEYWDYAVDGFEGREFYVDSNASPFTKIAFQPKKLSKERYWINQGNHSISRRKGMDPLPMRHTNAVIFHLPVRSANQLAIKLNQGVLSYMRKKSGAGSLEGEHWFKILEKMNESGSIAPDVLNGVAFAYGDRDAENDPVSPEVLTQSGYRLQPVDIALSQNLGVDAPDAQMDLAQLMLKLGGAFAVDGGHQEAAGITALKTQRDGSLVRADQQESYVYQKLPSRSSAEKAALRAQFETETDSIYTLIKDSYQEITNLTPTSWGGHIPFMFALASVVQPRRFVELGTHHGASFLAFCQATQRVGSEAEAVAIDCWEGDIQAGFYGNKVFEDFKFMLRPYDGFATYIRGFFEDAVAEFEDGSIDLLHIDGLHTYAAVKLDFETWLPKMSKDGLMIFHDINVHERDFGVWQLWQELTKIYPSAQFMHSHGLGILYVGSEKNSGVRAVVEALSATGTQRVLQTHFENCSQRLASLAMLTWTNAQNEEQIQNHAFEKERLTQLEQRNGFLESQNLAIRKQMTQSLQQEHCA